MLIIIMSIHHVFQEIGADELVDYTQQTVDQVFKTNPFDAVVDVVGGETSQHPYALTLAMLILACMHTPTVLLILTHIFLLRVPHAFMLAHHMLTTLSPI